MALITFTSTAGEATGYVSRPGSEKPGIIVLQEWWGLVPHITDVADRFAALGYVALAPDLYHGKSTVEAEEAHHLMSHLDWARATQEIAGAVGHLRSVERCTKVGVVGFCMGGALTMLAAAQGGIDAYAAFYGFPPAGAPVDQITAPGLIFFGEREEHFSIPDAQAFAARQRRQGRHADVIVYPQAGHGFFNDARPDVYLEAPANDAWRRTLALFGRHLR
ncbi:MAG: dienelactone hydrolase family protein [Vicinamibacterales bacterium]